MFAINPPPDPVYSNETCPFVWDEREKTFRTGARRVTNYYVAFRLNHLTIQADRIYKECCKWKHEAEERHEKIKAGG